MNSSLKTVYVADDDPAIVEVLQIILEDAGYKVKTTFNGETVRDLQTDLPDLILLDIWMSGINGGDICMHLKNRNLTKKIPIIMISANKDTAHIAKKNGANDFITKPFDMEELLQKVAKYLD